jgi:hypothetical protein
VTLDSSCRSRARGFSAAGGSEPACADQHKTWSRKGKSWESGSGLHIMLTMDVEVEAAVPSVEEELLAAAAAEEAELAREASVLEAWMASEADRDTEEAAAAAELAFASTAVSYNTLIGDAISSTLEQVEAVDTSLHTIDAMHRSAMTRVRTQLDALRARMSKHASSPRQRTHSMISLLDSGGAKADRAMASAISPSSAAPAAPGSRTSAPSLASSTPERRLSAATRLDHLRPARPDVHPSRNASRAGVSTSARLMIVYGLLAPQPLPHHRPLHARAACAAGELLACAFDTWMPTLTAPASVGVLLDCKRSPRHDAPARTHRPSLLLPYTLTRRSARDDAPCGCVHCAEHPSLCMPDYCGDADCVWLLCAHGPWFSNGVRRQASSSTRRVNGSG